MRVLVTGGGGFLGSAIVRALLAEGHQVASVARGDYPALRALGVEVHRGDLADAAAVRPAFARRDIVIHAAARPGIWGPRLEFVRANVEATRVVLEQCRAQGVRKLVFTSSPSVVFAAEDHVSASNDLPYPERYLAHYPETKAIAERMVLAANGPDLATVALRPHLVWGPGDPNLLPRLIARAKSGRLRIVGDGKNVVSITYIDNAAQAHVQAATALEPGAAWAGKPYFVNDADPVVLWEWVNGLLARLGIPPVTRRVSPAVAWTAGAVLEILWRPFGLHGEPPMTRFLAEQLSRSHSYDLGPARAAFAYAPVVSAEEGLRRTVAWWQSR
jgi:nucleoside-diphosphate-sugar epimerase